MLLRPTESTPVEEHLHQKPMPDGLAALVRRAAVVGKHLATVRGIDRPGHKVTPTKRPKQHGQGWASVGGIVKGPRRVVGCSLQRAPQEVISSGLPGHQLIYRKHEVRK